MVSPNTGSEYVAIPASTADRNDAAADSGIEFVVDAQRRADRLHQAAGREWIDLDPFEGCLQARD